MSEKRYSDSAEILSAASEAKNTVKKHRRNILRGIFYFIICAICFFILK